VGRLRLALCRASADDLGHIQDLIDEASKWLRTMSTDQWAKPWPSEDGRKRRIQAAIRAGRTWIAWDGARPAATLTTSPNHHEIWPHEYRRDPAVYVRRLVVGRRYSKLGLGAQLLDWAGLRASREYGARWVRVDVWRTNKGLHAYYLEQSFEFCGFCATIANYPSAALFQKRTDLISPPETPLFYEVPGAAKVQLRGHADLLARPVTRRGFQGGHMYEVMYRRIADDLRGKIESGEFAPGAQLPTETELMSQYGASRNTIRSAVNMLTTLGLVEARVGQGTFVTEPPSPFVSTLSGDPRTGETKIYMDEVHRKGRRYSQTDPVVEVQRATAAVAETLRIPEDALVVSRHYQRFIDGTPWSLQTSFYPMSLVEKGAVRLIQPDDIDEGAVEYIGQTCGIKQASYRDSIAVRAPDETEITFFRLPADGRISVFEIYRAAFDEDGQRIRLTITVYPADRSRFVFNMGDVPVTPSTRHNDEG
jgi:GntR family transcriptional regulator